MERIEIVGLPELKYARISVSSKDEAPAFYEPGCFEISYVAEGEFEQYPNSREIKRSIYDVFFKICDNEVDEPVAMCERHTVCFAVPYRRTDSQKALSLPYRVSFSGCTEVHRLIDEIISIHTLNPERTYTISGLILQLLDQLSEEALISENGGRYKTSRHEHMAISYIYKNIRKPITQKDVAAHLGITPEYFSMVFKTARGMTPMQFVNRVKLSSIRALMAKEGLKLYEAAELFGYTDPNYVSKLFKKYYGMNITASLTKKEMANDKLVDDELIYLPEK